MDIDTATMISTLKAIRILTRHNPHTMLALTHNKRDGRTANFASTVAFARYIRLQLHGFSNGSNLIINLIKRTITNPITEYQKPMDEHVRKMFWQENSLLRFTACERTSKASYSFLHSTYHKTPVGVDDRVLRQVCLHKTKWMYTMSSPQQYPSW